MRIVWTLPAFDDPKTGGEHFYERLKESLYREMEIVRPEKLELTPSMVFLAIIKTNVRNLKTLYGLSKNALIFQDVSHRKSFFLANAVLRLCGGRKIVLFAHEQFPLSGLSWRERMEKWVLNRILFSSAYSIIANSRSTAKWVDEFGDFKDKTRVLHPILKEKDEPIPRATDRDGSDVKTILCVANIRKNKGQEYLIEALGLLERKDLRLRLVGMIKEKDYYDHLRDMIEEMGLSGKVSFDGFLQSDELASAYAGADVFVLPTLKEGFGMVLLEAMAFSLPIIASNIGGIPELIDDGVNGLLISLASPKKIAEAIERVAEDGALRKHLGANALIKYRQMPHWDKTVENLREFLLI